MATKQNGAAPTLPPAQPRDPSAQPVACEVCGAQTTIGNSYSFVMTFATTGPAHDGIMLAAFQCPAEQHFCCSVACAQAAAHACIDEHLVPAHAERHAQRVALADHLRQQQEQQEQQEQATAG